MMKMQGKIFLFGVGPERLPFISTCAVELLSQASKVILDQEISDLAQDYIRFQCEKNKIELMSLAQAQSLKNICGPKENILCFSKVKAWGTEPTLPNFLQGESIITEPLPSIESGKTVLLLQKESALYMKIRDTAGRLQQKTNPLSGKRIVVTRAKTQSESFVRDLSQRGAQPIEIPSIRIEPHPDHHGIVEAIAGLNAYDWIVFSSTNGVEMFFSLFFRKFKDMRDFGGARIAAVGPATAERLRQLHLQVDVMPEKHTGKTLAKAIDEFDALENRRILLVRPETGSADLPQLLEKMGAIVDDIPFYCTLGESPEVMENALFRDEGADWLTFCSASSVKHFHDFYHLPSLLKKFSSLKIASIGPETTKALKALRVAVTVEADPYTVQSLLDAMEKYEAGLGSR